MSPPDPVEPESLDAARRLGETYAALVGQGEWQVDEVSDLPVAEPVESASAEPDPGIPVAEPTRSTGHPPLAEPVNEPTVPPSPIQIIEALLFVGGPPLTAEHAVEVIRGLTPEQFREAIAVLNRVYRTQNRPYTVEHGPTGYALRVGRRFAGVREKLYGGPREARLTQPALDVLALVAYRQPVAKADVDGVRGMESGGVLRQLVRLGLVAVTATGEAKEPLYGTTPKFLEIFRLRDLDDLPQLGEPKRVG
jgi:segregation and condensation protein B